MSDLDLLIDLHRNANRQGPGGDEETRLAIRLSGLKNKHGLKVADIGCGTGASTRVLAQTLDANITAVDFLPVFLNELETRIEQEGLSKRVEPLTASMDSLPFADQSLDAIWSEGAIYNMGFKNGITAWRRFLKPGGVLAVSELTWLTHQRPPELEQHWMRQYPEVDTASAKIATMEASGYSPIGYFSLSKHCWLENYYRPMQQRFADFLSRNGNSESAQNLIEAEEKEIALYERFSAFYSYGYFLAQRTTD